MEVVARPLKPGKFAQSLNLTPCFTPVASPGSNGISEAFVKAFKRVYIRAISLPDAETVLRQIDKWFTVTQSLVRRPIKDDVIQGMRHRRFHVFEFLAH